jgi:hypothetical protein
MTGPGRFIEKPESIHGDFTDQLHEFRDPERLERVIGTGAGSGREPS